MRKSSHPVAVYAAGVLASGAYLSPHQSARGNVGNIQLPGILWGSVLIRRYAVRFHVGLSLFSVVVKPARVETPARYREMILRNHREGRIRFQSTDGSSGGNLEELRGVSHRVLCDLKRKKKHISYVPWG